MRCTTFAPAREDSAATTNQKITDGKKQRTRPSVDLPVVGVVRFVDEFHGLFPLSSDLSSIGSCTVAVSNSVDFYE